jgi:2-polyprenyl-3-methyl-5-hydroxy-6-metoxy-1,4-benzoquinol methylase
MQSSKQGRNESRGFCPSRRAVIVSLIICLLLVLVMLGRESLDALDTNPLFTHSNELSLQAPEWLGFDVTLKSPAAIPIRGVKSDAKLLDERKKLSYEGEGEPEHIGGFKKNDSQSFEPQLWTWMINILRVSSLIDVGCGVGISTKWFLDNGVNVTCVEGSPSAVQNSLVPERVVEHDYTQGPWWDSDKIYDAVWSCEFLEHVDPQHIANYMATFSRARMVFATHAIWGGWHHVVIRETWWWVQIFKDYGFEYMPELTKKSKDVITKEGGSYFRRRGMVYRNLRYPWKTDFESVYFHARRDWSNIGLPPSQAKKRVVSE